MARSGPVLNPAPELAHVVPELLAVAEPLATRIDAGWVEAAGIGAAGIGILPRTPEK